jgi:CHASE3 domain sensor protein
MSIDLTNQEKLEEVYKLTLENNHLLHKMQSRDRIAYIFRVIYWLIILGALGGAYYYIRPAFEAIKQSNTHAEGVIQQFEQLRSQFPETKAFQQIFDRIKESSSTVDDTPAEQ